MCALRVDKRAIPKKSIGEKRTTPQIRTKSRKERIIGQYTKIICSTPHSIKLLAAPSENTTPHHQRTQKNEILACRKGRRTNVGRSTSRTGCGPQRQRTGKEKWEASKRNNNNNTNTAASSPYRNRHTPYPAPIQVMDSDGTQYWGMHALPLARVPRHWEDSIEQE